MGKIAQALGKGVTVTHRDSQGKEHTWNVSPWSYNIQAAFEQWMEGRAYAAVKRQKPHLTEDEYTKERNSVTRDIASGAYSFGGEVIGRSLQGSLEHQKYLFYLQVRENHPEVKKELTDDYCEEKYVEMMDAVQMANASGDEAESKDGENPTPAEQ